jgi:NAD(P)-dependent dehydrogenase (short-subunit alcohol dehydrogenase family)
MVGVSELWHDARHAPTDPKDANLSFKDKTVLVAGAYGTGLGYEAAVKYAALGANPLILAVRTQDKGEEAKAAIMRATNCSPDIFAIETLDLASFAAVQDFAGRINQRFPTLHVVQLAAGVSPWYYVKTGDGWEKSLQVNILSVALLGLLLLPKMRETATGPDGFRPHVSFLDSQATLMVDDKSLPTDGQTFVQLCNDEKKWGPLKGMYQDAPWREYSSSFFSNFAETPKRKPQH